MDRNDALALRNEIDAIDTGVKARASVIRPLVAKAWLANKRAFMEMPTSDVAVGMIRDRLARWRVTLKAEGINVAAGADADPIIWTPASVAAELEKTQTYINTLDRDMMTGAGAGFDQTARVRTAWIPFVDEFRAWIKSSPSTWWGATAKKAREYQHRAEQYRAMLEKIPNAKPTGPSKATPTDGPSSSDLWKYALGAAGVVAAFFAVRSFFTKASPTSSTTVVMPSAATGQQ